MEFKSPNRSYEKLASHATDVPAALAQVQHKTKRSPNFKKLRPRTLLWVAMALLLILTVGTAVFYINRYHDSQNQVKKLSNPTQAAKAEQTQLIDKVAQLTVLPKNETPTIATVTDVTKLKGQAFFENARNGDRVLIYTQAKEAFLYRPSTNKLINIAPLNIGSQTTTQGTATQPTTKSP